jgi:hypothetical protein
MRRQVVNFAAQRTPRWYGWGGLLLVALLAADAVHTYTRAARTVAANAEAHAPVARPATLMAPAEQRRRQTMFEDAQKLATRLATPWDGLFNAIERSGGNGVQVQAIRPNAGSRQIVIAAEARELTAMLNFLTRLAREPVLVKPYIQAQEEKPGGGGFALQFVVVAEWRQEPAK